MRDSDDARIVLAMTFKMGGFTIRVDWVMLIGREPFETCDLGSAPLATKVWMGFGLFLFSKLNRKSKFADLAVTKNLSKFNAFGYNFLTLNKVFKFGNIASQI